MAKILCIDDIPEETFEPGGLSLEEIINSIFKNTSYELIYKKSGKEGIKAASEDIDIKLVLLDIKFNGRIEGPEIADELQKNAPDIKVIVLTSLDDKGNKIRFGWKPNVVHYVVKKELVNANVLSRIKNLSTAIIEDFDNKNWELEYSGPSVINLSNKITQETFGINIPSMAESPLLACMKTPNKPVSWVVDMSTADLNKVHNVVNSNVLEETEWKMWGIFSRDRCGKGQLKLIIGSVIPVIGNSERTANIYVLQSNFEKFKKEIDNRLTSMEKMLKSLSPSNKK